MREEHYTWAVSLPASRVKTLPLLPIWPGFAINTIFYAAIAWTLWRIPLHLRRHRRRTRGLCVKCAYSRAGLSPAAPCPECGHAPPAALSAPSA